MDIINAIVLGIVEGLTEFIPVSSTGHLIIAQQFFSVGNKQFSDLFAVVIQSGAIFAVILYFIKDLWPFQKKLGVAHTKSSLNIWIKTIVASLPFAIIGLVFKNKIEAQLFTPVPVIIALIGWGVAIVVVEFFNKRKNFEKASLSSVDSFTWPLVLGIGLIQVLALWPGTSRSAVTILGALILGASRPAAAKFSFFLSIPVILGASLYELVKYKTSLSQSELVSLVAGLVTSFIVAFVVIAGLMKFIQKRTFMGFGWYRIAFGTALLVLSVLGVIHIGV